MKKVAGSGITAVYIIAALCENDEGIGGIPPPPLLNPV
jgi:hypothetical protein